jgi:hypothetical protein
MSNFTQKTLLPPEALGWYETTISQIKVLWKLRNSGFEKITGIQLKWRNGDTETDWSDMIGLGEGGEEKILQIEEDDWLTGMYSGYRPIGGGQDGALFCLSFTTHKGVESELIGNEYGLIANEKCDTLERGNIYGLSGTWDDLQGGHIQSLGGHILSLDCHVNDRVKRKS